MSTGEPSWVPPAGRDTPLPARLSPCQPRRLGLQHLLLLASLGQIPTSPRFGFLRQKRSELGARSLPHGQTGSPFPSLLALYRGCRGWGDPGDDLDPPSPPSLLPSRGCRGWGTPGDELGTFWGPAPPWCCAACCRPRAATPQLSSERGAGWCRGDARVCASFCATDAINPALNPPATPACAPGAFLEGVFSAVPCGMVTEGCAPAASRP